MIANPCAVYELGYCCGLCVSFDAFDRPEETTSCLWENLVASGLHLGLW